MTSSYTGILLGNENEQPVATCSNMVNPSWQQVTQDYGRGMSTVLHGEWLCLLRSSPSIVFLSHNVESEFWIKLSLKLIP